VVATTGPTSDHVVRDYCASECVLCDRICRLAYSDSCEIWTAARFKMFVAPKWRRCYR